MRNLDQIIFLSNFLLDLPKILLIPKREKDIFKMGIAQHTAQYLHFCQIFFMPWQKIFSECEFVEDSNSEVSVSERDSASSTESCCESCDRTGERKAEILKMAIRKRGDGWQIDYFDPTGRRVRRNFKKKKEAEAELAKRISLIAEKRYLDVKKEYTTTLEEVLEKYEENYKHQASYTNSKCHFIENFREYFGKETRLESIKYVGLETYRNHLRRKPTKSGTRTIASINREMACLHHIFEKAAEWEMIERNPFDRGKSLLAKENNKRLRFLTEDEIMKLIKECSKHLRPVVVCAINTGMRKGEILSLKWSQVRNGFIYLEKTKNNEARQIPINDTLAELFTEMKRVQGPGAQDVFTFAKGEQSLKGDKPVRERRGPAPIPEMVQNVRTAFTSALERAGIRDFRFHDLRHTFASHMIMRGASLKDLQELLGHKSMSMILRYAHLTQEHKKTAVNLLKGLTTSDSKDATVTKVSQKQKSRQTRQLIS